MILFFLVLFSCKYGNSFVFSLFACLSLSYSTAEALLLISDFSVLDSSTIGNIGISLFFCTDMENNTEILQNIKYTSLGSFSTAVY